MVGTFWQFLLLVAGIVGNFLAVIGSRMFLRGLDRRAAEIQALRLGQEKLEQEIAHHRDILVARGFIRPVEI